jgi:hypothetical protein
MTSIEMMTIIGFAALATIALILATGKHDYEKKNSHN